MANAIAIVKIIVQATISERGRVSAGGEGLSEDCGEDAAGETTLAMIIYRRAGESNSG
jgi:hypothetical protein